MTDENVVAKEREVNPWFSNKTYNLLKFVAQILLPALGTLYAAVAGLWGLPAVEQVVGTILAVDTFLGVILGISSAQYAAVTPKHDGVLFVEQFDAESGNIRLDLNGHPAGLVEKKVVSFKVETPPVEVHENHHPTPGDLPPVPPGV